MWELNIMTWRSNVMKHKTGLNWSEWSICLFSKDIFVLQIFRYLFLPVFCLPQRTASLHMSCTIPLLSLSSKDFLKEFLSWNCSSCWKSTWAVKLFYSTLTLTLFYWWTLIWCGSVVCSCWLFVFTEQETCQQSASIFHPPKREGDSRQKGQDFTWKREYTVSVTKPISLELKLSQI